MRVREGLSFDRMGHWLLDYLLSAFSLNSSWKERGGFGQSVGVSKQTPYDFAMLNYFINEPKSFSPRMHYDLGLSLWELGVWERGGVHMREFGVDAMTEMVERGVLDEYGKRFLGVMTLREALHIPLVSESSEITEELWLKLEFFFAKELARNRKALRSEVEVAVDEVRACSERVVKNQPRF